MSLITDISGVIAEMYPDVTFMLSSTFQANVSSLSIEPNELPLIVLDNELSKDNNIAINNNIQKNTRIVISVLYEDNPENTDVQSESLRSDAETIADRLAAQIYQLLPVRIDATRQKYKCTPLFHVYATNLTGVAMEMQVNYNEVVNFTQTVE